jgi:hypothetical protein
MDGVSGETQSNADNSSGESLVVEVAEPRVNYDRRFVRDVEKDCWPPTSPKSRFGQCS